MLVKTKKREKPTLSKNIIARRKALGWKGHDLAFHSKIPYPTIRDIEAGTSGGWLETREAIAKALNCSEPELHLPVESLLIEPVQNHLSIQDIRKAIKEELAVTDIKPKAATIDLTEEQLKVVRMFKGLSDEGQDYILKRLDFALKKFPRRVARAAK